MYKKCVFSYNTPMTTQNTISFDRAAGKYRCVIEGESFTTKNAYRVEYLYKKLTGVKKSIDELLGTKAEPKVEKFGINQRFDFVEKLVKMVAAGVQPSAVITGQGGLGKTFTVVKTLKTSGLDDATSLEEYEVGDVIDRSNSFVMVKGYSTPKGLYRTLFENNGSVIVFDDCDSVLKDPVALNLLKGALDSYDRRFISWNADMRDDDLPKSFEFTGRIVFISNMSQEKIDQAIRSRSMMIDLSMTDDQKIERMEAIASSDEFMPEYTAQAKTDAIAFIKKVKADVKELSLRSLISVTKIASTNENWEELAEYMLCN